MPPRICNSNGARTPRARNLDGASIPGAREIDALLDVAVHDRLATGALGFFDRLVTELTQTGGEHG